MVHNVKKKSKILMPILIIIAIFAISYFIIYLQDIFQPVSIGTPIKQFESIGISCQSSMDCQNYLVKNGMTQQNQIPFRCNDNVCEIEKIEPIRVMPKK